MARRRRNNNSPSRKLLINAREPEESRIAVLSGGVLDEYYIERESLGSTLGNIYKARITNVEKSIGAAFVDFGHNRQGFLHVSDLCMAAVTGEAAQALLAGVQAAREVAHEEDVVEPRKAGEAGAQQAAEGAPGGAAGGDGGEASEEDGGADARERAAADEDDDARDEADAGGVRDPDPDVAETAAATDGDAEEDDDEDGPAYTPDEVEDDAVAWSGTVAGSERGAQLKSLDQSDDDDESDDDEPEEAELIGTDEDTEASSDAEDQDDDDDDSDEDDDRDDDDDDDEDEEDEEDEEDDDDADRAPRAATDDDNDNDDDAPILLEIHGPLPSAAGESARAEIAAAVAAEHRSRGRGRRRGRRRGRGRGGRNERGERAEQAAGASNGSASAGTGGGAATATVESDASAQDRARGRRGRRGGRQRGGRREVRAMPPIEDILQKGQEIVVQVIKDGIGTKGPTLTTYLSIPGRFIVLMPGIGKRGVSRKVTDQKERERLKAIVRDLEAPEPLGFIVRTAGSGASKEDLERDLAYLISLWDRMQARIEQHRAPVLLYQENDLVIRTLRDLYDGQGEIVIDHQGTADKARDFLQQILPQCVDKVQAYTDTKPIFSHYGLEAELTRLLKSRLELKSGASLIIEQTEALVAVDVNSGRYKPDKHKDIDETAYQVNCEAAVEVARQIRLRDMGGVVVIDFIDMRQEKHRKQLERLFKDELRKDRARIKVARFSPFGILEMTRQRVRPSLKRTVHQSCPYCEGTGYIPSDETSCLSVVRKIRENLWRPGAVLVVTVRPEVAEALVNTQRRALVQLEDEGRKQIFVRADHRLAYEEVDVKAMITLPDDVDHRRA